MNYDWDRDKFDAKYDCIYGNIFETCQYICNYGHCDEWWSEMIK